MATTAQWVEGARPRTLPAAVSPVLAGTGAAAAIDGFVWWKALLCLGVGLALQVGVNYANDYSDGIRGTDDERVGPLRLVGSGVASPHAVRTAAVVALGVGAVLGLVLALTSAWWLLLVGAAAIAAAWYYTGGERPYGYAGLGELAVFVFFGLVAVLGTTFVQAGTLTWASLIGAVGVGALACAILVANNLRDIPTDVEAGKRTLATRLGDARTRVAYTVLVAVAYATAFAGIWVAGAWVVLLVPGLAMLVRPVGQVTGGASGRALVPVLRDTGLAELVYAAGLCATLWIA